MFPKPYWTLHMTEKNSVHFCHSTVINPCTHLPDSSDLTGVVPVLVPFPLFIT